MIKRVAQLDRAELIQRYRTAYADSKRLVSYVMAGELIERAISPCFWHELLALDCANVNQRADLMLADLAWLRRWHPDHARVVRYQRGKALLTGTDAVFHREAGFAFDEGKRPAWKIVESLSMTECQQWESAYLRSTPIKREAEATAILSERVRLALLDDLRTTRRTAAFGEAEAMEGPCLPSCTLALLAYGQGCESDRDRSTLLANDPITLQAAANQLEKVRAALHAKGDDFMT